MKKRMTQLLFLLTIHLVTFSQALTEFGELSSSPISLFNAIDMDDGLLYFINDSQANKLVKINYDGDIIQEVPLPFDTLYYNGHLLKASNKIYLVGFERLWFTAGTPLDIWESQKRSVLQFNFDLELEEIYTFDLVPFGGGETIQAGGLYVRSTNPTSLAFIDGKINIVAPYPIFDVFSNPALIVEDIYQLEVLDLAANTAEAFPLEQTSFLFNALFLEEELLLYGETADTIVNGTLFNSTAIARYNYKGEKMASLQFDENNSGGFTQGSVGQIHNGRLYSSYFGFGVNGSGCPEDNTTIDIRYLDFDLETRFKIPDCDYFPFGKTPFTFTSDGGFYFYVHNNGKFILYRYNADLTLAWSQNFTAAPSEYPVSTKLLPGDGVLLENIFDDSGQFYLKLYAFTKKGNPVSNQEIPINTKNLIRIFPNPAQDFIEIKIRRNIEMMVSIFQADGQLVKEFAFQKNRISVQGLAKGIYLIQIRDKTTGVIIDTQPMIKQ